MIPAITWAILATGGGIAACALSEYQRRWKEYWAKEAEEAQGQAEQALRQRDEARAGRARSVGGVAFWIKRNGDLLARLHEAEDQLRTIKLSRHNAAVKARQAQLSQQANKELRTELVRRQTAEREAA